MAVSWLLNWGEPNYLLSGVILQVLVLSRVTATPPFIEVVITYPFIFDHLLEVITYPRLPSTLGLEVSFGPQKHTIQTPKPQFRYDWKTRVISPYL